MDTTTWVLLVAALVVMAIAAAVAVGQERRREKLRRKFGPEYKRLAKEQGESPKTDAELAARQRRRKKLEIRPLEPAARERYAAAWESTQARFVDAPESALAEADDLVNEVMRERGYPVDDFEQRATDISVDHPDVVQNYRAGHAIAQRQATGTVTTEDLRRAVVHYRALFDELLETNGHRTDDEQQHEPPAADRPLRAVRPRSPDDRPR